MSDAAPKEMLTQRAFRRGDEADFLEMLDRCSEQTRYRRFLGSSASAGAAYVRGLVDTDDHHTIVVEHCSGGRSQALVAIASVLPDSPGSAEIVVLVEDAWQGRGLGIRLVKELYQTSAAAGLRTLTFSMLASNIAMRKTFGRTCPGVRYSQPDQGVVEGVIPLPAQLSDHLDADESKDIAPSADGRMDAALRPGTRRIPPQRTHQLIPDHQRVGPQRPQTPPAVAPDPTPTSTPA